MQYTLKTTKVLLLSVLTFELLLVSCNGKPNGRLEENRERTALENYFLMKNDRRMYSIFFVYCNDGFCLIYDTALADTNIRNKRYFSDSGIKITGKKVSTKVADENLPLADFIDRYLYGGDEYYHIERYRNKDLFERLSEEEFVAIAFATQYNYDFLILSDGHGRTRLYPPDKVFADDLKQNYDHHL